MSVVVDASVLIEYLVNTGRNGQWAEQVMRQDELYAPELIYAESMNGLRRLELAGQIRSPEARMAVDELQQFVFNLFSIEAFAERAWELRHVLTIYDAWYVALAESLQLPLATLDLRMTKARGVRCDFLLPPGLKLQ